MLQRPPPLLSVSVSRVKADSVCVPSLCAVYCSREDQPMSDAAVELIQTFSALSRSDQYAVLLELARISEANAGPLSDEELTAAGESVFAMYDAEEAGHGEAQKG